MAKFSVLLWPYELACCEVCQTIMDGDEGSDEGSGKDDDAVMW